MLNIPKVCTQVLGSITVAAAMLSAPAAMAEVKVATVRSGELVASSPQFKAGQTQMKNEFDKRKADLEREGNKFLEDLKKFQQEADVMAGDARANTEKNLQARKIDLDYKQRQFQEDFQKRDQELTQSMMNKIKEAVLQVSKEKALDVVIQDPVYGVPNIDITADVLKKLQASGPVAPAAAPAKPAAK